MRGYLYSILLNLVSNAIKYRHPQRPLRIVIATQQVNGFVRLSVRDNGLGMNLNGKADQIFALYKRLHNHVDGKGLGLYLVKTQAEVLGGRVEVESQEGTGSTFTIYLKNDPKPELAPA
ncbi:MAG: ATP-binding protein [Bernardetiaceae bacterium]|nr:ATP-binding protein [Bernardetiaceae bacterium]